MALGLGEHALRLSCFVLSGVGPLIEEIIEFVKSGKPPVSAAETLEILAFMEAADHR